ncbi:MAG: FTR1 family iron permease [Candidatus Binataceae bacterium]
MMNTTSTVLPYFLYSTGILFREGCEALLVIIALVAGTREAGQSNRARDIYAGALAALALSIALAWGVNHVIGDNASDTLEGVFQLFAAATLFYVSSWITSKTQADHWNKFIRSRVEAAARSRGPSIALALTAFLAVMREGAETIVFFQALAAGATQSAEHHAVMAGVATGAVALAITFFLLNRLAFKLPIRRFFSVTSVLLYALAVIFVGQGIASFQESGWVAANFVNHVPTIEVLGVFPTVQTLLAQGALLLLALGAVFMPMARRARQAASNPSPQPRTT